MSGLKSWGGCFLLMAVLSLGMAGCGGANAPSGSPTAEPEKKELGPPPQGQSEPEVPTPPAATPDTTAPEATE